MPPAGPRGRPRRLGSGLPRVGPARTPLETDSGPRWGRTRSMASEGRGAPELQPGGAEENPVKRFLKMLGPGFITGASDDDPSGIGTYAVAGASFGFATLWTALLSFPLM